MSVSNEHLTHLCQVWDGRTYLMMPNDEAEKLESMGKIQRCENLQAKDLLNEDDLKKKAAKIRRGKAKYKTREMKAED